ncbi:MAG: antitoxin family protein [Halobacteriota archaeon]
MQKTIEVVYEKGVFKPLEKVELKEGTKVKIPLKAGVLKRYYRSIPITISKDDIEQFRLELLER